MNCTRDGAVLERVKTTTLLTFKKSAPLQSESLRSAHTLLAACLKPAGRVEPNHSQNIKYLFYFNFRFCVSEEKSVLRHLSITDRSERRIYANAYKML